MKSRPPPRSQSSRSADRIEDGEDVEELAAELDPRAFCNRNLPETIGTSLKIEKSRFVRLGPRECSARRYPYAYCCGVAHASPETLNDVSNQ
jgi:hypothetical protein